MSLNISAVPNPMPTLADQCAARIRPSVIEKHKTDSKSFNTLALISGIGIFSLAAASLGFVARYKPQRILPASLLSIVLVCLAKEAYSDLKAGSIQNDDEAKSFSNIREKYQAVEQITSPELEKIIATEMGISWSATAKRNDVSESDNSKNRLTEAKVLFAFYSAFAASYVTMSRKVSEASDEIKTLTTQNNASTFGKFFSKRKIQQLELQKSSYEKSALRAKVQTAYFIAAIKCPSLEISLDQVLSTSIVNTIPSLKPDQMRGMNALKIAEKIVTPLETHETNT